MHSQRFKCFNAQYQLVYHNFLKHEDVMSADVQSAYTKSPCIYLSLKRDLFEVMNLYRLV